MLPGKTYTPEDILAIARKRIWFVLLPLAVVSAATSVWVRQLPNLYRADSSILVVPQRVPSRLDDAPAVAEQRHRRARGPAVARHAGDARLERGARRALPGFEQRRREPLERDLRAA